MAEPVKRKPVLFNNYTTMEELITALNKVFRDLFGGYQHFESNVYVGNDLHLTHALGLKELAVTPDDPSANQAVIWLNSSGELWMKYNDGASTTSTKIV